MCDENLNDLCVFLQAFDMQMIGYKGMYKHKERMYHYAIPSK